MLQNLQCTGKNQECNGGKITNTPPRLCSPCFFFNCFQKLCTDFCSSSSFFVFRVSCSHDPDIDKTPPSGSGRSKPLWGGLRTPKGLVRATGRILGGNGKGKTDRKSLLDNDHAQEAQMADMHSSFQRMMTPDL